MRSPMLLPLALGLALPLAGRPPSEDPPGGPVRVERRLAAMGTWLELRLQAGERAAGLAASERALAAIEACERRLSTWGDDSELARLNHAPLGEWQSLSPELAHDLERARRHWLDTGGAFDPGLGALVEIWGLRTGGRRPSEAELVAARGARGFAGFELEGGRARRLHARAAIEEGGFGKGLALDAALAALTAAGVHEAAVDLGGQLALLGAGTTTPLTTTLADPRARARAVLELELRPGSFATSGNSERGIVVDGVARAHLLDPWSGAPCADFGSLSVWARDATTADCLSTGLYVMGPEAAQAWCATHPGIEFVLVLPEGERLRVVASAGWRGRLRPLVSDLDLRFVGADPLPSPSLPALTSR